jgi:vacuolar-type H+-ATPase catalytic subunit A/Vma1
MKWNLTRDAGISRFSTGGRFLSLMLEELGSDEAYPQKLLTTLA